MVHDWVFESGEEGWIIKSMSGTDPVLSAEGGELELSNIDFSAQDQKAQIGVEFSSGTRPNLEGCTFFADVRNTATASLAGGAQLYVNHWASDTDKEWHGGEWDDFTNWSDGTTMQMVIPTPASSVTRVGINVTSGSSSDGEFGDLEVLVDRAWIECP